MENHDPPLSRAMQLSVTTGMYLLAQKMLFQAAQRTPLPAHALKCRYAGTYDGASGMMCKTTTRYAHVVGLITSTEMTARTAMTTSWSQRLTSRHSVDLPKRIACTRRENKSRPRRIEA